jgi:GTP-binding protein
MKITSASFLRAAQERKDYPQGGLTEIAFAGRSNVGKSSAINALLGRRKLVKTSKTPGHTRKLNFFLVNERFVFVDFPGYGFAQVPLEIKRQWGPMIETYLGNRKELAGVVTIIDARRAPTESDMALIGYLRAHKVPFVVAATKADKLTHSQMTAMQKVIREQVGEGGTVVLFSATSGLGRHELWKEIKNLMELGRLRRG